MNELETLVRSHRYVRNHIRVNLGGEIVKYGKGQKQYLKIGHLSNTVRSGPIIEKCKQLLGDQITAACLNHNVVCPVHRDSANVGDSWIAFFGDYTSGGDLNLEDGRVFDAAVKNYFYGPFRGSETSHWNTPHSGGDKWSLVAFAESNQSRWRRKIASSRPTTPPAAQSSS